MTELSVLNLTSLALVVLFLFCLLLYFQNKLYTNKSKSKFYLIKDSVHLAYIEQNSIIQTMDLEAVISWRERHRKTISLIPSNIIDLKVSNNILDEIYDVKDFELNAEIIINSKIDSKIKEIKIFISKFLIKLARQEKLKSNYTKAIVYLIKAYSYDNYNVDSYEEIVDCFEKLNEKKKALKYLDKLIDLNSENIEYHWKSFLINNQIENVNHAIINLSSCIMINPDNPNFYNIRAVLLYKNGQQGLAMDDYYFIEKRFGRRSLSKEVIYLFRGTDGDLPF